MKISVFYSIAAMVLFAFALQPVQRVSSAVLLRGGGARVEGDNRVDNARKLNEAASPSPSPVEDSKEPVATDPETTFDWGEKCDPGSGAFSQAIAKRATVSVGTIPVGKADVRVDLISDRDVDIQLIDVTTGKEIVAWPRGILNGPYPEWVSYEGMSIGYSGYNGDGHWGKEWITVEGEVTTPLEMRAYGYQEGTADVEYTFNVPAPCDDTGSGEFTQNIAYREAVKVGIIPAGKRNVRVELKSEKDVDIQLIDVTTGKEIVAWPRGILNGPRPDGVFYEDMGIGYSGFNGDGHRGNEWITVEGKVTTPLEMRAYGYQEGTADVKYAWGIGWYLEGEELGRELEKALE